MYKVNICPKGDLFYNQICLINCCFINRLYCTKDFLSVNILSAGRRVGRRLLLGSGGQLRLPPAPHLEGARVGEGEGDGQLRTTDPIE